MKFKNILNEYIIELKCTAVELAESANISGAILSRYRTGKRVPKANSNQLLNLAQGIVNVAKKNNIDNITFDDVYQKLTKGIEKNEYNYDNLTRNFNQLINLLNINCVELAKYLGYDPSYLSKIKNGVRRPFHCEQFINGLCDYIVNKYDSYTEKVYKLIDFNGVCFINNDQYIKCLKRWLLNHKDEKMNNLGLYLKRIDNFNCDSYLKSFNSQELTSNNFYLIKEKKYYGIKDVIQSELDFFKTINLLPNNSEIYLYNNLIGIENDQFTYSLVLSLKKNICIKIIRNIDQIINEIDNKILNWIPIFMTGKVSLYYINDNNDSSSIYLSNKYCLISEHINEINNGRSILTSQKRDISYCRDKVNYLLSKSKTLISVFDKKNKKDFYEFIDMDKNEMGERLRILSSLPLHTISNQLLLKILDSNNLDDVAKNKIIESQENGKEIVDKILDKNMLIDVIHFMSEDEFIKSDLKINIDKFFYEIPIKYTYNTYLEHYNDTIKYSKEHYNYKILEIGTLFKNLDIYINNNKYVLITKKEKPYLHFLIRQKDTVMSLEEFLKKTIKNH